jgi:hypothetical protein
MTGSSFAVLSAMGASLSPDACPSSGMSCVGASPGGSSGAGIGLTATMGASDDGSGGVLSGFLVRMTVRWVIASRTMGGTAATAAASTLGTSVSAETTACTAFAVTEINAPPPRSIHGYHALLCPARATTETVATTMMPSTISGHAHA